MKLNIVTPLSRGENLQTLYENVKSNCNKGVDIKWWVIIDPKAQVDGNDLFGLVLDPNVQVIGNYDNEAIAGHAHRNLALNVIQEDDDDSWFMSLDDDNILHPDLIPFISRDYLEFDKKSGIIFDQVLKDGSKRLVVKPNEIGLNKTDTAQFILKVKDIGSQRFDETRYDADGLFIYEFYEKYKENCELLNIDLCFYNYLR